MYPPLPTSSFPAVACSTTPGGRSDYELTKSVYDELSRRVREMCPPVLQTLTAFGIGSTCDWNKISKNLKTTFTSILTQKNMEVYGLAFQGENDPRLPLIAAICSGLGLKQESSDQIASELVRIYVERNNEFKTCRSYTQPGNNGNATTLQLCHTYTPQSYDSQFWWVLDLHRAQFMKACDAYTGVIHAQKLAQEPFRGTPYAPKAGIDQLVELMKQFPAFLEQVYSDSSLCNIKGFPPELAQGMPATSDDARFIEMVRGEIDADWYRNFAITTGVTLLAIVAAAFTGGTMGVAISIAFSVGKGSHAVYHSDLALKHGRGAQAIGGMTRANVVHLEGELRGAWATLVIDTLSASVLAPFSPTGTAGSTFLEGASSAAILTGFGAALSAALNPNVWNDENCHVLILKAFVVGAGSGYIFGGLDKSIPTAIGPNTPAQIALRRQVLAVGASAYISVSKNGRAIEVEVTEIDRVKNTVSFRCPNAEPFTVQFVSSPIGVYVDKTN